MPHYDYRCQNGHVEEQFHSMLSAPDRVSCKVCHKTARKLIARAQTTFVHGKAMNSKSKDQFRFTFGKKKSSRIETTRDVDRCFDDFHRRYPHLGHPGGQRHDPFPSVDITDERGVNE